MAKRGVQVNDPHSTVLVDNISGSILCLPRENNKSIIFKPGQTVQITWAEFVRFKNTPHFGRYIKLNDAVVISDGAVKVMNTGITNLSEEFMIEMLVQSAGQLKEFVLTLNEGEALVFKNFLTIRKEIGIEPEKCEDILLFLNTRFPDKAVATKPADEPKKELRKAKKPEPEVVESETTLSAYVKRTGE